VKIGPNRQPELPTRPADESDTSIIWEPLTKRIYVKHGPNKQTHKWNRISSLSGAFAI
jgi:hypothetical protein